MGHSTRHRDRDVAFDCFLFVLGSCRCVGSPDCLYLYGMTCIRKRRIVKDIPSVLQFNKTRIIKFSFLFLLLSWSTRAFKLRRTTNVIKNRFTIYKVNKASKKKREKSSAKKERKATKTLAIVLGKSEHESRRHCEFDGCRLTHCCLANVAA